MRVRGGPIAIGVVLFVMVLVEAATLRHTHTLGVVLIGLLAGLGLVIVLARGSVARIGVGAAYLSAFTLTWNGWFVGPERPGDLLVLVALMCFAAADPATLLKAPPWWIKQLVYVLLFGLLLILLFPPSQHYLAQRLTVNAGGGLIHIATNHLPSQNIGIALKFIIAVAIIPVAYTAAALVDPRAVRRLAISFATGSALSGLVAFIDHTHVASIGHYLTHLPNVSDRQIGFSDHYNFLAAGLVLAIPFACWLLTSYVRRDQWIGAATLLACLLGVYASGSRGGAVCSVGTLLVSFVLLPRTRPHLPSIIGAGVVLTGLIAVAFPSFGFEILKVTRLRGNATAAGSSTVRAEVGAQGVRDFHHSPIHGIGLQVSTQASQVYLQELASGGLILLIGMSVYMLGGLWESWKRIPTDPLAAAIAGSLIGTLALNIFEADLTDRFYYVPEAILVAMVIVARVRKKADEDSSVALPEALEEAEQLEPQPA